MVGARTAEGAGHHQAARAERQRRIDGDFAVGPVLVRRKHPALDLGEGVAKLCRHRVEIADPQLRRKPERRGMEDAGIGRDHPRAGGLRVEPRRADELAAEEQGEGVHG